jgi:hypothetical protein
VACLEFFRERIACGLPRANANESGRITSLGISSNTGMKRGHFELAQTKSFQARRNHPSDEQKDIRGLTRAISIVENVVMDGRPS